MSSQFTVLCNKNTNLQHVQSREIPGKLDLQPQKTKEKSSLDDVKEYSLPNFKIPLTKELASALECPVCFEYCLPPIKQCKLGHLLCEACRTKVNRCPICRRNIPKIRNLAMENTVKTIAFPCKYAEKGCDLTLNYALIRGHESACSYRDFSCPLLGGNLCHWVGLPKDIITHFKEAHKCILILNGQEIVFSVTALKDPSSIIWIMVQECFDKHFMLMMHKKQWFARDVRYYVTAQMFGTRAEAEKFMCKLEVNGKHRSLAWEATPLSCEDRIDYAIMTSDCLTFDGKSTKFFEENDSLNINVTTYKVEVLEKTENSMDSINKENTSS